MFVQWLQVLRTEHVYWKTETPEDFAKENFPVFCAVDENEDIVYGTPIHEYPGLIKVLNNNMLQ